MFKNKFADRNNICGIKITELRIKAGYSQRKLAEMLQLFGMDLDKNAVQRIESGQRFVTDIEIKTISKIFNISADDLLI